MPARSAPCWLLWIAGRFDPDIRSVLPMIGQQEIVSAAKAKRELGWTMRPLPQTMLDTADSLTQHQLVRV